MEIIPPQTPPLEDPMWQPHRKELRSWFERQAPSLGDLYVGAVRLVYEKSFPGRLRFVAHAVREIKNRLPDVIVERKGSGRLDYTRLDSISDLWKKHVVNLSVEGKMPTRDEMVSIPAIVAKTISEFISDHVSARGKTLEAAFRLFEGLSPTNKGLRDSLRPVVLRWKKITDWFEGKAHDPGIRDSNHNEEEFTGNFELFETTLCALVRGFYSTIEGLDEILEDTNN